MHTFQRAPLTRRRALRMSAAAATLPAASALTACGGPDDGGGSAATGDLNLIYLGDATQQKSFNALFDEFNKAHPKIRVKARGIASKDWATFANTVSTQIAGGKVPDIVQVATEGQRLFASKGLLEPLDAYIDKDKKTVDAYFADVDPKLRRWTQKYGSTDDGRTYYIPGGYNTVVMYLNTEVFAEAGVDLPSGEWTWDDFRQAGLRIKERTGAFLLPVGYGFPFVDILPWLLTNGTSTLNSAWDKGTYDSPEAVEAAAFVKSLVDDGLSPKPGGTFDAGAQLAKNKLAALGGGRWPTADLRRLEMVDKVRIVSWPVKAGRGSPVGWDGWPILKASKKKQAAWTFLKWLMTKDASQFYASIGGTNVPARNSVAESASFTDEAPEGTGELPKAIGYGAPIPSPIQGAQMQAAVTQGWQAAITGTKPVREALEAANSKLSGLL
ncbi:putative ABC transporter substrate-binding protein YesO [Streptomyces sp. YIM 130001]|uniref:ABC transporter substrate-binding protein n=1 Tax=Streptomyces sp. YIM 130001 TaxID=2259644 RepID=UPI000ECC4DDB|nr:sugar ABC transporter substrate-binding protein [Streptomyces sp. YIM 130001]RII14748.1 putative ABC transporter substrate-binding protein YesO [Streptomyces sp. YIM 130001]